jgi:hypothetical protein
MKLLTPNLSLSNCVIKLHIKLQAHLSLLKYFFLSDALGVGNGEGYFCGFAIDYGFVTNNFFSGKFSPFCEKYFVNRIVCHKFPGLSNIFGQNTNFL